jgi:hypothetical protein
MKAVGSQDLGTITAADRNELGGKIIELIAQHQPAPLLVKLNTTFDNTYIVDRRYRRQDPAAIEELVYFTYDKTGKQIRKFFEEQVKEVDKEMQHNLEQYGLTMGDYYYALYAGMPANQITRAEIKENLKMLSPFEYNAVQKITDLQQAGFDRIDEKMFREFGIRVKMTFDEKEQEEQRQNIHKRWRHSVYNTTAERKKRDEIESGKPTHPLSYRNRFCILELGRIIRKGGISAHLIDPLDYFRKFHPEVMVMGGVDNNILSDNEDERDYLAKT